VRKPNEPQERKPLRAVSWFVMACIVQEINKARHDGYSADEIARHLWQSSVGPLQRTVGERFFLADVLTAWSSQLESDARAEERTRAYERGDRAEPSDNGDALPRTASG